MTASSLAANVLMDQLAFAKVLESATRFLILLLVSERLEWMPELGFTVFSCILSHRKCSVAG